MSFSDFILFETIANSFVNYKVISAIIGKYQRRIPTLYVNQIYKRNKKTKHINKLSVFSLYNYKKTKYLKMYLKNNQS